MKYVPPILILLCLLCGASATAELTPVTITGDYCYASETPTLPQTIVSLVPSNTEILFALGLGDKVVGVTEYCNYPTEARTKSIVGGISSINFEKIVALDPDLILASSMNGEDSVAHLRKLGYSVLCLNSDSIEGTFSSIHCIGEVTGAKSIATELVTSMQQRLDATTEKIKTAETTPQTVKHLMSIDPYWISGNHTFQNELITLAGGINAFPEVDGWGIISLERLLTVDPDVILVDSSVDMEKEGGNHLKQLLMADPRLSSLSAVKNGRIYVMNADIFDRGGPRIVDALDELIAVLYPASNDIPVPATPQTPGFGLFLLLIGVVFGLVTFKRTI
jgi:iron complex transport system substrate-binding protein